ncbi:MAG TPA: nuclear transport factor 2 family protein [Solirubrobacteraceae bacterium]|jgi:ketosteroid isomerase-like protein|nr:nuclear transport factor 2 family protein [Solirubrobacteraceae bacterium]
MSEQTAVELEQEMRRLFMHLDAMNVAGISAMVTDNVQGIDEITRSWRRGRAAVENYLAELADAVQDVRSQITDLHVTGWDETGLVTFVLQQTYRMDGAAQSLSAPTSLVFKREDDAWKVALIHSVPLPEPQRT